MRVPYTIRSLKPHEMEELTKLWVSFMQDPLATNLEFVPDSESKSRWQQYISKHIDEDPRQVLVAEENGKLVGYLLYNNRSHSPVTRKYNYATIEDIYVLPECRRRGIASKLLETCLRQLRETGVTHIRLQVLDQNDAAKSLYMKFGFVVHMFTMEYIVRNLHI